MSENYDGLDDLGDDGRLIKGNIVKFNSMDGASPWKGADVAREYIVVGAMTVAQKWAGQKPTETHIKTPTEPLPDIDRLNDEIPQSEWETGLDGKPRPPWQRAAILYLLEPRTATALTFVSGSVGGFIGTDEVKRSTAMMRRLRKNDGLSPIVKLSQAQMKTRFGARSRPKFEIVGWTGDDTAPALETSARPQLEASTAKSLAPTGKSPVELAAQRKIAELKAQAALDELDDQIPF